MKDKKDRRQSNLPKITMQKSKRVPVCFESARCGYFPRGYHTSLHASAAQKNVGGFGYFCRTDSFSHLGKTPDLGELLLLIIILC